MARVALYSQVYNMEKDLEKCIESVLGQTFTDFTYYIFDNGSEDGSWEMVQRYARQDNRIVAKQFPGNKMGTFSQSLQMICATGAEFLAIVDADDWVEPDYLENAVGCLDECPPAGLVMGAAAFHNEGNQHPVQVRAASTQKQCLTLQQCMQRFTELFASTRTHWAKLFRVSVLKAHNIQFPAGIRYGADTIFVYACLRHCDSIVVTPKVYYHYILHGQTIRRYFEGRLDCDRALNQALTSFLESGHCYTGKNKNLVEQVLFCAMWDTLLGMLSNIADGQNTSEDLEIVLEDPTFAKATRRLQQQKAEHDALKAIQDYVIQFDGAMSEIGSAKRSQVAQRLLQALAPQAALFWGREEMHRFYTQKPVVRYLALGFYEVAWQDLQCAFPMPNDKFFRSMHVFLAIQLSKPLPQEIQWADYTKKQRAYILPHLPVLEGVENPGLLLAFHPVAKAVWQAEYTKVLPLLPQLIVDKAAQQPEAAHMLAQLGLTLAALENDTGTYVFCLKAEVELLLAMGRQEAFWEKWETLFQMLPGDEDLLALKKAALEG